MTTSETVSGALPPEVHQAGVDQAGAVQAGAGDAGPEQEASAPLPGRGRCCLVVDDSRVVRKVARRILESSGFIVREAENGLIALESCRATMPDCVLLDWNMPVMDGLQFLKALRAEFGPDNPPVLFCTTENDLSFIEAAIANGAQEYIMKPFDEEILLGKFEQVGLL